LPTSLVNEDYFQFSKVLNFPKENKILAQQKHDPNFSYLQPKVFPKKENTKIDKDSFK
jgi:hypothetical protein